MESNVSPVECLMREHSLLHRLLLIYEGFLIKRPARANTVLMETAELVRCFVEEYHQTLEEEYVFPLFIHHGIETRLVQTLLKQHHAARYITAQIRQQINGEVDKDLKNRQLDNLLKQYITMYAPHSVREDTELFPLFRGMVNESQWDKMGEQFQAAEERRFGQEGFKGVIQKITLIEKTISINDLDRLTPDCQPSAATERPRTNKTIRNPR